MKSTQGRLRAILRRLLLLSVCTLLFTSHSKGQEEPVFESGVLAFHINHEFLAIPQEIQGIIFDTIPCITCKDSLPSWRYLGELKIDSLVYADGVKALTEEAQVEGISVHSSAFLDELSEINPRVLQKIFPNYPQGETTYNDTVRQVVHTVPDLSKYYKIHFSNDFSNNLAADLMKQVGEVNSVDLVPVFYADSAVDCSLFSPNDPRFSSGNEQWEFHERSASTDSGGAMIQCALALLADGARGAGVKIAVIDRGIERHPVHQDFDSKIVSGKGDTLAPGSGHGDQVVGILAAETDNSEGIAGVAPDAQIISYNSDNTGPEADIEQAVLDTAGLIVYAYHSASHYAPMDSAVKHAWTHNIPVIVSSGNNSPTIPYTPWPGSLDNWVITVGAHDYGGYRSLISNYPCDTCAQWLDVVAPGSAMTTTQSGGGYTPLFSGTSAAVPVVAGMVAVAKGYNPNITVEDIESFLQGSANSHNIRPDTLFREGYGRFDALEFMQDVINAGTQDERKRLASSFSDSLPGLIITADSLASSFQVLADRRTKFGVKTAVKTLSSITSGYSGADTQEKIRACIKDYHDNKYTEYVTLGGDADIIPVRLAFNSLYGPGVRPISDFYYACLDGDWNDDADTLFGELDDDVDLDPEVAVGRIPVKSTTQVTDFINKLISYESADSTGFQTKVAAFGSKHYRPGDGKDFSLDLLSYFPGGFTQTRMYDDTGSANALANYFTAMNAGQGIVLLNGLAQHDGNYCLIRQSSPNKFVRYLDVDTLKNVRKPSVVMGLSCWQQMYSTDTNLAEHYMRHSNGGAVAYIGATHNDFTLKTMPVAEEFFTELFGSGPSEIGKLLNNSKAVLFDDAQRDGGARHTMYDFGLSGDPSMRIWTASPSNLTDSTATSLQRITSNTFNVKVTSGGSAVQNATVCLKYDTTVYKLGTTNSSGIATFSSISFPDSGYASIVATKHNYVAKVDSVHVSCCANLRGNVNYDAADACNIVDQTYLVQFMFNGGPWPPCVLEADVNGSGTINVTDVNYLTQYLFNGGPAPVACP